MKEEIIPSVKLTKNCGRSPSLIGKKTTINGTIFHSYVKLTEGITHHNPPWIGRTPWMTSSVAICASGPAPTFTCDESLLWDAGLVSYIPTGWMVGLIMFDPFVFLL
jgi:hypothetical protein